MSRVGKLPVEIPSGVTVDLDGLHVKVKGPKGELNKLFRGKIAIESKDGKIVVSPLDDTSESKAMWGTARSIINGMVQGVSKGFTEELEINGVGYRAAVKDNILSLSLAKSHGTKIIVPEDIKVQTPKQTVIILESCNKEKLGQFTSLIIKQRPPEPYKGKGIKRKGQYVQRKEGKKK